MFCTNLREILLSFLCKSSRLRISVRAMNAKKELFSWADLYVRMDGRTHVRTTRTLYAPGGPRPRGIME